MTTQANIVSHITALSPHGQIVVREDYEIVVWNDWVAKASGIASSAAVGSSLDRIFPELDERVVGSIAQCLRTGMSSVLSRAFSLHPFPLRNRQYRDRQMAQSVTVSGFQDDGCRYALVNILDVSREVQREQLLRQQSLDLQESTARLETANNDLEMFSHMVGHDLRAPLRAMLQFSEFLVEDLGDDLTEPVQENLRFIVGGAQRLTNLVDALMRLSKVGNTELVRAEFALSDAVDVALLAQAEASGSQDVQITRDELPIVFGDHDQIVQVFQNLISNASKFVDVDKVCIHISVEKQGGETVLGVRDNGIGIDPCHAERVFTPFQRLHAEDVYEGCGIGLAVCSKVIARHGGRIWFDTDCETGAHVRFTLASATKS